MRKNPRPHGPMPFRAAPMGPFQGQPPMMMGQIPSQPPMMGQMPGQPPMMGQEMGFQPFQQPFGEPYAQDIPQISIEQVQMEIQPLVQYGTLQLNRIAMIGYLIGLGYPFEEARQMVESYLR